MATWSQLSPAQRAAALHDDGPAAVFAGPGSGKTRVVTLRAARLAERGARVLVTTFTTDATEEMRARMAPLLPARSAAAGSAHITTLHAFCLSVLRQQGQRFQLLTDDAVHRGLAEAAMAAELDGGASGFLSRVGYLKNTGQTAAAYRHDGSHEDREFAGVWRRYERQKTDRGVKEFDDLLLEVAALFETDKSALRTWAGKFTHVLVDETQDMNRPQYRVALALGSVHHNVMLVGDPDQSLYAFRGADAETFQTFASHPSTRVYELRENYRSTRHIVAFADSLIRQNEQRRALEFVSTRDGGADVQWRVSGDAESEALAVGAEVLALAERGARYRDMAVLFRMNAQAEAFERHFAALGIPFVTRTDGDFYARKEVAGLLAYLEFFTTHADEWLLACLNVPNRKLARSVGTEMRRVAEMRGRTVWESLAGFTAPDLASHRAVTQMRRDLEYIEERLGPKLCGAADAGAAIKLIRQVLELDAWLRISEVDARDNDRIQNLNRIQEAAERYPTVQDYLAAVRKVREETDRRKSEAKKRRQEADAVTLCTGHAAKGLEWRFVFAAGWSEEILPHRKAEDPAEELRIAYVMATRARDALTISSIQTWNGASVAPSRFLTALNLRPTEARAESAALTEIDAGEEPAEAAFGGLFAG